MTPVEYHEAAEDELLNEVGYLELRAAGLGRRFFAEVRRAENLISQYPQSAGEILPGIRKRVLRKFRYSLIYTIAEDRVLILPWPITAASQVIGSAASAGPREGTRAMPDESMPSAIQSPGKAAV